MKPSRIRNCLNVVIRSQVRIRSGDCRESAPMQVWHSLGEVEIWVEIGVMCTAAIARPPTGVERQFHQVREPWLSTGASRPTTFQSAETIKINRVCTFQRQICVEKL